MRAIDYVCLSRPLMEGTKAMTPEASVLDNFCYALRNISKLQERPEGFNSEIVDLLFKSAELATFAKTRKPNTSRICIPKRT